jgi:flagella basal body P-ring formation protein FlgA
MRAALLTIVLLCPLALSAAPATARVEALLAAAWAPRAVRVEWTFQSRVPASLEQHDDWQLSAHRPPRLAGSLILVLERPGDKLTVSGTARIFDTALSPGKTIPAGQPVTAADLSALETDVTQVNGELLTLEHLATAALAAHALVPGRPLLTRDLKAAPLVRRGQTVALEKIEGVVRIKLVGRALKDGALGEVIDVAVDLARGKRFKGRVGADGRLQLVD